MSIRCLRIHFPQVSQSFLTIPSQNCSVRGGADWRYSDAAARQSAEQQLAQAAEVNFVSTMMILHWVGN